MGKILTVIRVSEVVVVLWMDMMGIVGQLDQNSCSSNLSPPPLLMCRYCGP